MFSPVEIELPVVIPEEKEHEKIYAFSNYIISKTADVGANHRAKLIAEWLNAHPHVTSYVLYFKNPV